MASIVVEVRAYYVAIVALEFPYSLFVGISVYENPAASRTNWGGILFKRDIEALRLG